MIAATSLTKRYGEKVAVDDMTFTVRPGIVTGFLGPNGAGKSTTMRLILGLDRPTSGGVTVNGKAYRDAPAPLQEVGALLEARAVHTSRSAYNHLRVLAATHGISDKRVDEVLDMVGLTEVARKRVGAFSLGMGQRLGIASALLGDPSVLILDEPVNGLDPAGIHWMRGVLRQFAANGGTVLLSSHLLHEVEMIADELVVIGRGKIVAQGTRAELLQTAGTYAKGLDADALATALQRAGIAATPSGDGAFRCEVEPVEVGRAAAQAGVVLVELRPAEGAGLEEMFLELTADDARDQVISPAAPEPGVPA